ncbi:MULTISPECIES: YgaP family membrane protein [Robertmurraya]|uniref:DUF2892 domain-containing protein n=1 Tax=Robertmurraya beringensis TaxID=641660 RepID=A0ABV6KUT4_9BACI|nr:Protein of uncharacterised function (DUF2892) [Mycobacteroides abscessus subsp. abscessus]
MNVKPNIGILNALVRITIGLSVLAWSTAKHTKMPWRDSYVLLGILGAMKVAEGIVRFCPITALYEREQNLRNNQNQSSNEKSMTEQFLPYNTQ